MDIVSVAVVSSLTTMGVPKSISQEVDQRAVFWGEGSGLVISQQNLAEILEYHGLTFELSDFAKHLSDELDELGVSVKVVSSDEVVLATQDEYGPPIQ